MNKTINKTCDSITDCSEEKRIVFNKNGHDVLECNSCEHRYCQSADFETHLKNVYSDYYFFNGKDGYPNYLEEKEILIKQGVRYAKTMSKYIASPGNMLDIGCAAGFILKGFEEQGWACHGVEPNKTMVEYGIKEFGFDIQLGGLEEFVTDKKFDLILLIQVIGHFQDLDKALQNISHLLKPGGFVLVESWNRNSMIARFMGKHWHEYSPPSVIQWFTDKSLINLFEFYGFSIIDKGYPLKQINIKHAISLIENMTPDFALKQKIINFFWRSIGRLKIIYPPIDIKWYVFQKRTI
jgi:SAM-dependent methyltransferase